MNYRGGRGCRPSLTTVPSLSISNKLQVEFSFCGVLYNFAHLDRGKELGLLK